MGEIKAKVEEMLETRKANMKKKDFKIEGLPDLSPDNSPVNIKQIERKPIKILG